MSVFLRQSCDRLLMIKQLVKSGLKRFITEPERFLLSALRVRARFICIAVMALSDPTRELWHYRDKQCRLHRV